MQHILLGTNPFEVVFHIYRFIEELCNLCHYWWCSCDVAALFFIISIIIVVVLVCAMRIMSGRGATVVPSLTYVCLWYHFVSVLYANKYIWKTLLPCHTFVHLALCVRVQFQFCQSIVWYEVAISSYQCRRIAVCSLAFISNTRHC